MFESILSCKIGTFTVDTAVSKVTAAASLAATQIYRTPSEEAYFKAKDNLLIKSISFVLPYCFSQADDRASLQLYYERISTGAKFSITEIGTFGRIWFYSENAEQEINAFWQWKANIATETATRLHATLQLHINPDGNLVPATLPEISMLNCPAALHGVTLPIFSFIRILHTLPIQAIP